jgi:hypothetical protein
MWLCLNRGFFSVVEDRENADRLLIRARVAGHIESVFPEAKVFTDAKADYFFRAFVDREEVALQLSKEILEIDYDNFKATVADKALHDAYLEFWTIMYQLQRT